MPSDLDALLLVRQLLQELQAASDTKLAASIALLLPYIRLCSQNPK